MRLVAAVTALAGVLATVTVSAPAVRATTTTAEATGGFTPLRPYRALDTRNGTGGRLGKVGPRQTVEVPVLGLGGVPLTGVAAVAVNVTATAPTTGTYVTAYPTGSPRPLASTLNVPVGATVPSATTVGVGTGGSITLFNSSGSVHLVVDVAGWYADSPDRGDRYLGRTPVRALDTRDTAPMGSDSSMVVDVRGAANVPDSATAVALNVTVTQPTSAGYLTVYGAGDARPLASNLNFRAGRTVANFVVTALGNGAVEIYNSRGRTHVVVDVVGVYGGVANSRYRPVVPSRVLDTRTTVRLGPGEEREVALTGVGGIPERRPAAVAVTLTVTRPTEATYLTMFPARDKRPEASTLNVVAGETRANHALATVDQAGHVKIYNYAGFVDVVVDVVGWFDRPVFVYDVPGTSGQVTYASNAVTPADVVVDPESRYAYVTNPALHRVEVLDLDTGLLGIPIPVGAVPTGIDMNAAGTRLYVANRGDYSVSEIDVALRAELRRIQVLPPGSNDHPYSLAVLADGRLLVATTFSGSGFGARMLEVTPAATPVVKPRGDFFAGGSTTERTEIQASGDRRSAAAIAGDISSGPVFRYDIDDDKFSPEADTDTFLGHVAIDEDGSVVVANGGSYLFDATMTPQGSIPDASGAGVVLSPAGETSYTLRGSTLVVADVPAKRVREAIYLFSSASWYTYLNNHRLAISPDQSTLVGLTDRGITLVRL